MSSSCIPIGLRLDLDMVKAASPPGGAHSSPLRPAHSSPSSTLSEASSSATSVSLKRARAPRKRPNQAYNEAAALLASIHPSVFPVKKSPKTAAPPQLISDLLPPLPVLLADSAFLLRDTPAPENCSPAAKNCSSPAPVSSAFREFRDPAPQSPASPDGDELGEIDFDDDCFDAESILDDVGEATAAEGIDGIMGSLTVESSSSAADDSILSSSSIHPHLRSLMVVGLAGRFELGLGLRHGGAARPNLNGALKRRDDDGGAWWMWPAVPVKDLTVAPPPTPATPAAASNAAMPQAPSAPEKKKSKKKKVVKVEKVIAKDNKKENAKCKEEADASAADAANGDGGDDDGMPTTKAPKTGLGLKLDAGEVLKAWSDKGSMFAEGSVLESTESAADVRAKLADIDLFPENGAGGGIREASVLRYKEKRRTRLFSKKIRYQVRKVNADCRPRMKGRFVRSPSLLQQALEEES